MSRNNHQTQPKALIIGAAGFVGGYLADHLHSALGWQVAATKLPYEQLSLPFANSYDLDIMSEVDVEELLAKEKPDYIFHLAAQSSVATSWKRPELTVEINICGTLHVLDAVRKVVPEAKVMLIGSGEEYGHLRPEDIPVHEEVLPRPGNPYAVTKNTQNQFGRLYAKAYGLHIISTRSFNHIGPNQLPGFVVPDFCKQVAEIEAGTREAVIKVGNLSAKRDFTDVRDIVHAYGLLAQYGLAGETYNIGSGQAVSVQSILDKIVALSTKKVAVEIDSDKLRPVDVPVIEADISKLQSVVEWKPQIALSETLKETLQFWREKVISEK